MESKPLSLVIVSIYLIPDIEDGQIYKIKLFIFQLSYGSPVLLPIMVELAAGSCLNDFKQ